MLDLKIDDASLKELGKRLGATEGQITRARDLAVRETQKQAHADAKQRIVQGRIIRSAKVIRSRVRQGDRAHHGPDELHVWLGAGAVYAAALGKPRAYGKPGKSGGVRVGGIDIPGAFLAKVYKRSSGTVWMRVRSKRFDPYRYAYKYRRPGDRGGINSRFPVASLMLRVKDEIAKVAAAVGAEVVPAFKLAFGRKLMELFLKNRGGAK